MNATLDVAIDDVCTSAPNTSSMMFGNGNGHAQVDIKVNAHE